MSADDYQIVIARRSFGQYSCQGSWRAPYAHFTFDIDRVESSRGAIEVPARQSTYFFRSSRNVKQSNLRAKTTRQTAANAHIALAWLACGRTNQHALELRSLPLRDEHRDIRVLKNCHQRLT
jgi:hypothetical protein